MRLKASCATNFSTLGSRPSAMAMCCSTSSCIADAPAPEAAWYVATCTRRMGERALSGASATTIWMVVQLGLPMIRLGRKRESSPLTSGTTSGTSGSMRKADELSIIRVPWRVMVPAYSSDVEPPAETKAIFTPEKSESWVSSSTVYSLPRKVYVVPALRFEPKRRRLSMGKLCSSSTRRNSWPTAPLTPTIAMFIRGVDLLCVTVCRKRSSCGQSC